MIRVSGPDVEFQVRDFMDVWSLKETFIDNDYEKYGFRIEPNDPLEFSSSRVHSVSPDYCDMRGDDMRATDSPVWIIGGGKTAMDTAHVLITEYPGREVNLVAGSGTFFTSRERLLPTGAARWWGSKMFRGVGMEAGRRFDGTNEADVEDWYRSNYGTWLTPGMSGANGSR